MVSPELTSKIELSVSCRNLADMDLLSKSDPMCVLFQKINNRYAEVDRTEVIKNNHSPVFSRKFLLDYHFEERQLFKIEIYDVDSSSYHLLDHDFLGWYEFSLGQIVSKKTTEAFLNTPSSVPKRNQMVILTCVEMSNCKEVITLQFSGYKLDKKDFMGKSDPLLEFYRAESDVKFTSDMKTFTEDQCRFTLVHRNKPIMNNLNPNWPPLTLRLGQLCLGDSDRILKIVCSDWNSSGKLDFIGQFYTSVNDMMENQLKMNYFKLINPKKKMKKKNYENSGCISVNKAIIQTEYSFFDYISGGLELHFSVAIDFTASNGHPNDPRSLHYINSNQRYGFGNQYELAIYSVGSIVQEYDEDKMFPSLGFGARLPPTNDVSFCFPITFQPSNPFSKGVDGLLQNYRNAIRQVTLYGPTNFAPCIRHVENFARTYTDGSRYFVLLIITDGIITDFEETIEAIIDCSRLPMALIIIGVGQEDFSAMEALDCDKGRLRIRNKMAERDIVQFVAIRDFITDGGQNINHIALSKAVLQELPNQVTGWMRSRGLKPLPRRPNQKIIGTNSSYPNPMSNAVPPVQSGSAPYPSPVGGGVPPAQAGSAPYPSPVGGGVPPTQGGSAPYPSPVGGSVPPVQAGSAPYPGPVAPPYNQVGNIYSSGDQANLQPYSTSGSNPTAPPPYSMVKHK